MNDEFRSQTMKNWFQEYPVFSVAFYIESYVSYEYFQKEDLQAFLGSGVERHFFVVKSSAS